MRACRQCFRLMFHKGNCLLTPTKGNQSICQRYVGLIPPRSLLDCSSEMLVHPVLESRLRGPAIPSATAHTAWHTTRVTWA